MIACFTHATSKDAYISFFVHKKFETLQRFVLLFFSFITLLKVEKLQTEKNLESKRERESEGNMLLNGINASTKSNKSDVKSSEENIGLL